MSSSGDTKRAEARGVARSEEDRRRKTEAVGAVNKLFGMGDFREQNMGGSAGFTKRDDKGIYLGDLKTATMSPFVPSTVSGKKFTSSLKSRKFKKEPI